MFRLNAQLHDFSRRRCLRTRQAAHEQRRHDADHTPAQSQHERSIQKCAAARAYSCRTALFTDAEALDRGLFAQRLAREWNAAHPREP